MSDLWYMTLRALSIAITLIPLAHEKERGPKLWELTALMIRRKQNRVRRITRSILLRDCMKLTSRSCPLYKMIKSLQSAEKFSKYRSRATKERAAFKTKTSLSRAVTPLTLLAFKKRAHIAPTAHEGNVFQSAVDIERRRATFAHVFQFSNCFGYE